MGKPCFPKEVATSLMEQLEFVDCDYDAEERLLTAQIRTLEIENAVLDLQKLVNMQRLLVQQWENEFHSEMTSAAEKDALSYAKDQVVAFERKITQMREERLALA
eukprot:GEMP01108419.1.p2 GENE.GEMP01108419.1~~GEMP01108419.1.p2  ORF type:complete len:105 (+),score=24.37 GEMP01108419.1:79-393(+)